MLANVGKAVGLDRQAVCSAGPSALRERYLGPDESGYGKQDLKFLGDLQRRRGCLKSSVLHSMANVGAGGDGVIVRDHHDRQSIILVQLTQQLQNVATGFGIEVAGWLVGQQQVWDRSSKPERWQHVAFLRHSSHPVYGWPDAITRHDQASLRLAALLLYDGKNSSKRCGRSSSGRGHFR